MYGWRGRIGLMLPYDNTVIEPEFHRTLPDGVSAHVLRTTKTDRKELAEESVLVASAFANLRVDMALYACNASSFMQGWTWHDTFLERFEAAAGVPSASASSAMIDLMRHRRLERVVLVTPYPEWLLEPLRRFVEDAGVGVAKVVGLGLEPLAINALGPADSYRYAKASDVPESDGVFVLATNFRTLEALAALEHDLGKPVMSSNHALMWCAQRHLRVASGGARAGETHAWPVVPDAGTD